VHLILAVRVQPGARRNQVVGLSAGVLRVKVAAPAVEGKANAALTAYLAELLGVRPRQVTIVKGDRSRDKLLRVEGLSRIEVEGRLGIVGSWASVGQEGR